MDDAVPPRVAEPPSLLPPKKKNRNKKGLALIGDPPPTYASSSVASTAPRATPGATAPHRAAPSRPAPIQVASRAGGYRRELSEQVAALEWGVEFKLDLKSEDLVVRSELGSGNGGTVSRCEHVPTGVVMAKKVVHIATSESTRKQIVRELQIMHDCNSPFIVSFYGAFLQDPHICMCMEFMDKGSLDNIYKKVGPIPTPILGKIALAVVTGLTYLYEVHKIMHRDVKPSNILLNSQGQIKICDFGVSGELINSVADTFVGTSTYMSPERISGDPYTVKSDVWSLGITLVELALGRFPFSSEDEPPSSDEEPDLAGLSLADVQEDGEFDGGEETLSPVPSSRKSEALQQAEEKRRSRVSSLTSASSAANPAKKVRRKSVAGVSLAGSGHQMSILELLQYIVNEPAPHLPKGGKFPSEAEEFVDATLRKEPVGWNVKRKGPLPEGVARPTPKELLDYKWMKDTAAADTDVEAFARSIP